MPAILHRLRSNPDRLDQAHASQLRQFILNFPEELPAAAVQTVLLAIDRSTATANRWTFVMLSPSQNALVVRRLSETSERPKLAVVLWAEMLTGLRVDTGEVLLDRAELGRRGGASPSHVSAVLREMEDIGAISRRRVGRQSTIFVNPNVATQLTGGARDKAQAEAPPVQPVGCVGGKSARRAHSLKIVAGASEY